MATIRKRGDAWQLRWAEGGRQCQASLGRVTATEAERIRREKDRELARARAAGVVALPRSRLTPTLNDFAVDYLVWHRDRFPASADRVESILDLHILPYFGLRQLDTIGKTFAQDYPSHRAAEGAKAATIAKEMRTLHAVLNRAVFLELIDRSPIAGVAPPRVLDSKPPRWYTAAELELIYEHARVLAGDEAAKGLGVNSDIEDYAPIWRLMANTGMRRAEAQQLRWADVEKDHVRILSSEGARTKSGRWRFVPLSAGALAALEALKGVTGGTAHVLPQRASRSLTRAFGKALDRAGLDGSLHCLRHTFCAHLVSRGVPLRTVQVLAGHASVSTTERYAHLAPGHLQDAVSGLAL